MVVTDANNEAGAAIGSTPRPGGQGRTNPYAKTPTSCSTPVRNPYAKKPAAAATIISPARTPVGNPYAKSTPASAASPKRPLGACDRPKTREGGASSCRRKIDFSGINLSSDDKGKPAERTSSSTVVNLSSEFGNLPVIRQGRTYTLYFDGGSRGNPGVAGAGMAIYDDEMKEIWSGKVSSSDVCSPI